MLAGRDWPLHATRQYTPRCRLRRERIERSHPRCQPRDEFPEIVNMSERMYIPLEADPQTRIELHAVPAGDGQFRLVGAAPTGQPTQFKRGETVECEIRALPNGKKGL